LQQLFGCCSATSITNTANHWEIYTDADFSYSISYPPELEVVNNGSHSMLWQNNGVGHDRVAVNFVYVSVIPKGFHSNGGEIYNYNTSEIATLLKIQIGQTNSLREGFNDPLLQKAFSYTRLADTKLGGLDAKVYENMAPWEFPLGVKEYIYYVENGKYVYLVGGYIEALNPPYIDRISAQTFNQMLSTMKFYEFEF
jgi:hypothetical protein